MRIVHLDDSPNRSQVRVSLASGEEHQLWIEANRDLSQIADCWLFLMLPIGMGLAEDIEIVGTLSKTAVTSFYNAQEALLEKHPHLAKINLNHNGELLESLALPSSRKVACFFSGGLDSSYTAETIEEIRSLIAVWGFDIQVWNEKHWKLTSELLQEHADEMGKELILVRTNIREISNGLLSWGRDYHGSALAGVANALSNHLETVYVSSTHSVDTNRWGQFPRLSKAFSTDYQQLIEYGARVRTAKAIALKDNPRTRFIRVCYRNKTGKANCGACQKCIRTRLEFALIGAQYRPIGLESKPSFWTLMNLRIEGNDYSFFKDSIGCAKDQGYPKTLLPSLALALARLRSIFYFKFINPQKAKDFWKPPANKLKHK